MPCLQRSDTRGAQDPLRSRLAAWALGHAWCSCWHLAPERRNLDPASCACTAGTEPPSNLRDSATPYIPSHVRRLNSNQFCHLCCPMGFAASRQAAKQLGGESSPGTNLSGLAGQTRNSQQLHKRGLLISPVPSRASPASRASLAQASAVMLPAACGCNCRQHPAAEHKTAMLRNHLPLRNLADTTQPLASAWTDGSAPLGLVYALISMISRSLSHSSQ